MAITKIQSESLNLADTYAFTGTVTGAGEANKPAFAATASADQSVASGVDTKVVFNSEIFDTDSCYDPTTNYRFTPNKAGKYFLMANIRCRRTTDFNDMNVSIKKNGSNINRFQNNSSFHNESQLITTIAEANGSSDYFEVFCSQSSGETDSAMNVFEFSGFYIGN